jgi:hypothetical protein
MLGSPPVRPQLDLMNIGPVPHQARRAARKLSVDHLTAGNRYSGVILAVPRVEMRWRVIL